MVGAEPAKELGVYWVSLPDLATSSPLLESHPLPIIHPGPPLDLDIGKDNNMDLPPGHPSPTTSF
jgi:hypothetical protein